MAPRLSLSLHTDQTGKNGDHHLSDVSSNASARCSPSLHTLNRSVFLEMSTGNGSEAFFESVNRPDGERMVIIISVSCFLGVCFVNRVVSPRRSACPQLTHRLHLPLHSLPRLVVWRRTPDGVGNFALSKVPFLAPAELDSEVVLEVSASL